MPDWTRLPLSLAFCFALTSLCAGQQRRSNTPKPDIPKTWDDAAIATLEVPLAASGFAPKHVSADYYYKIPVQVMYKQYPVYAPGHEPPGYIERLKQQEPIIVWDDKGHAPALATEQDWVRAGELVFDYSVNYGSFLVSEDRKDLYVRDPEFYRRTGTPVAADGTVPFFRYVVKKKGEVEIRFNSCAMCHTRVRSDGTILKGAQGNVPFDRIHAYKLRTDGGTVELARDIERLLFYAPWLPTGPPARSEVRSMHEIAAAHEAIPPGVIARHRTNPLYPAQVPDLIGVKDRHYLDRTGLQQQRSIVDLMRYAALNQGADHLASFGGFIPADLPNFATLPKPETRFRYSDEQLYALALYAYSLKPPPNPNKFDALAAQGQRVFKREGCPGCHTPPLYTNNKLTLAPGFDMPAGADKKFDILPISVATDPGLAMSTRRGTGYYKVPSLKGVWYRSMFGHSGWCATLEDWLNPDRLRDDYVPTGFKPYGRQTYAVQGHPFGLNLNADDRKALIAFLKTL